MKNLTVKESALLLSTASILPRIGPLFFLCSIGKVVPTRENDDRRHGDHISRLVIRTGLDPVLSALQNEFEHKHLQEFVNFIALGTQTLLRLCQMKKQDGWWLSKRPIIRRYRNMSKTHSSLEASSTLRGQYRGHRRASCLLPPFKMWRLV